MSKIAKDLKFQINSCSIENQNSLNVLFKKRSVLNFKDIKESKISIFGFPIFKRINLNDYENIYSITIGSDWVYKIQTFNFAGNFCIDDFKITINLPDDLIPFFYRMIQFCNEIYIDKDESESSFDKKVVSDNILFYLISYLFKSSLKKISSFSLPLVNTMRKDKGYNIRGKIDFNSYLKKDIFDGTNKVNFKYRTYEYDENIVNVIYKALSILKKLSKENNVDLNKLYNLFNQIKTSQIVTKETLNSAYRSKALLNPMLRAYKRVLDYAAIILKMDDYHFNDNGNSKFDINNFLIYVPQLFEIYIYRIFERYLSNSIYEIEYQKDFKILEGSTFQGNVYLDFLIRNKEDNTYTIIDTKFKNMEELNYQNLDRPDLYQVTSYAYFLQNKGYKIKNVVLLYKSKKSHFEVLSSNDDGTRFIISSISTETTKEHPYFSYNEEASIDNLKKYL